jgi:eukaryotic-like serine/threonine-protein kinase
MPKPAPDARRIFDLALEIDSSEERARFLAGACGSNGAIRDEIASLFAAFDSAGNFLENALIASTQVEGPGSLIGSYKLLEKIGEGGMGAVYVAEQSEPIRRKVALKIIKPGMDSRQVIARFEAERQALAMMDHPSIAKIFEAGTTASGRPYFVMELVKGVAISTYCDQAQLTPHGRLELLVSVCQATHHAHQKGIIHRDIKPSNVLVSLYDGTPVPKMIDFGVAKAIDQRLTESTLYTQHGAIVGTLEYMSPEQAENSAIDVDTRTDVYALGVLLFELMTGTTPLEHERLRQVGYSEVIRRIREEESPRLSVRLSKNAQLATIAARRNTEPAKLARIVKGELDWITMKALSKDRNRRYETANDLARDLERFLAGQPVEAAPPSKSYLARKYASKHRVLLTAAAAVMLIMAAATVFSIWQAIRVTRLEAKTDAVLRFFSQKVVAAARLKSDEKGLAYDVTLRDALEAAEPGIAADYARQPVVEASIRDVLGSMLLSLGVPEKALVQFERAFELRTSELGKRDPETLESMNNLAVSYRLVGRFDEAIALHEKELRIARSMMGEYHPETLTSMNNLGVAYRYGGRGDDAIRLLERVLARRSAVLKPDDPDRLTTLNDLAVAYRAAGRYVEALPLHEEDLRRSRLSLPPDHPDLLIAMNNVARAALELGQIDRAITLFEEALKLRISSLGAENLFTVDAKSNLALAHQADGRFEDAVHELGEVVAARKAKLSPDHADTLRSIHDLALALGDAGRRPEATSLLEKLLERRSEKPGRDHPDTLKTINDLATLILEARQWDRAEPLLSECLKFRQLKKVHDWRLFQTKSQLGAALAGQNKPADAERLLIEGYEGLKAQEMKIPYLRRNEVSAAIARLVDFYDSRHETEQAQAWRRKLPPTGKPAQPRQ